MASRDPKDLCPELQIIFAKWDAKMHELGIDYILTCTRRTQEEQETLWEQGRRLIKGVWIIVNNKLVRTWTLHSLHILGRAFDFCIMVNGKPDWQMTRKDLWDVAIAIGKSLGLSQVVNSKGKVMEFAHLQLSEV